MQKTDSVVETTLGPVQGSSEGGLHIFRGIPFAPPPVGERRWLPPQPAEPWREARPATGFGPSSPQNPIVISLDNGLDQMEGETSEDCLYLNVWTPGIDAARRPVMVWIHGGGFVIGSGRDPLCDPGHLAKTGDAVLVSLNYRLACFGFLRLVDVTGGAIPTTGNEGLLDQVAALEWVRDNIERFGGDPGNVTIFGVSAGRMSAGTLFGMPAADGLYQRAILQSGACQTVQPVEMSNRVGAGVLQALETDRGDPDAIRALSAQQLCDVEARLSNPQTASPQLGMTPFQPCVDGRVLPCNPLDAVRAGAAAGVDMLMGSTLHEYKPYGESFAGLSEMDFAGLVEALSMEASRLREGDRRGDLETLVAGYRRACAKRGAEAVPPDLFLTPEGDRVFWIPAILLAEAQRPHRGRAFHYVFTWESPFKGGIYGACHGLDVGFVFGTIDSTGSREFHGSGPEPDALAAFCQAGWLNFARNGDPTGGLVCKWLEYGMERATMLLGSEPSVALDFAGEERRAWRAAGYPGVGRL